jgi:c-di-GMP-binding flagellar brake protein YcgR
MVLYMVYQDEQALSKKILPTAWVEEYWEGKERRKHVRFKKILPINYTVEKKLHLKSTTTSVDISEGGMKLLTHEKLNKGAILDLKIKLDNTAEEVEVEGQVVWCEDIKTKASSDERLFYIGMQFSALKESSGKRLVDYVHSLAGEAIAA